MFSSNQTVVPSKLAVFVFILLSATIGGIPGVGAEIASTEISPTLSQEVYVGSNRLPLWLHTNTWGTVPIVAPSSVTSASVNGMIAFENNVSLHSSLGLVFRGFDEQLDLQLSEVLIAAQWKGVRLRGGIARERRGEIPMPELSSGSLSISGNAQALPRVQLSSPDYLSIPFSHDSLAVKAGISHGWFTGDRWVRNTFLHEKWAYLRVGDPEESVSLYGGLIHHAMWGGSVDPESSATQPANASWGNFVRVFAASSGGDDAPETDQINVIGDQLGTYDIGFSWRHEMIDVEAYYQHFFEDGSGMRWRNGLDGLFGVAATPEHGLPLIPSRVTYERILTQFQSGEFHDVTIDGETVVLGGRDSYYHNGVYRTGWTHQDRILGTPLFVLQGSGADARIASNRIRGHHIGVAGAITEAIDYRFLSSHVWHYPAYASASVVSDDERKMQQWSALAEVAYEFQHQSTAARVFARVGWDVGSIYDDSWGMGMGISAQY